MIQVDEPFEWVHGRLFGIIENEISSRQLMIRLQDKITEGNITSDLMRLSCRYGNDELNSIIKGISITIGGELIDEISQKKEYLIVGSLSIH